MTQGTWMNSDSGYDEKKKVLKVPSNVTRFVRALRQTDIRGGDAIPQIVYYQASVGARNMMDKLTGGVAGEGLDENAYAFISKNWTFRLHEIVICQKALALTHQQPFQPSLNTSETQLMLIGEGTAKLQLYLLFSQAGILSHL
jgi:hypothetical protein